MQMILQTLAQEAFKWCNVRLSMPKANQSAEMIGLSVLLVVPNGNYSVSEFPVAYVKSLSVSGSRLPGLHNRQSVLA